MSPDDVGEALTTVIGAVTDAQRVLETVQATKTLSAIEQIAVSATLARLKQATTAACALHRRATGQVMVP